MSVLSTSLDRLNGSWVAGLIGQGTARGFSVGHLARALSLADAAALTAVVAILALASGYGAGIAIAAGLLTAGISGGATAIRGGYAISGLERGRSRPMVAMAGVVVTAVVAASSAYLLGWEVPRRLLLTALGAGLAVVLLNRAFHQLAVSRLRRRGQVTRRALLVDPTERGLEGLSRSLTADPERLIVLGRCGGQDAVDSLGSVADVPALIRELQADTLIVSANAMDAEELRQFSWRLQSLGVEVFIAPAIADVESHRVSLAHVDGTPLLQLAIRPRNSTMALKAAMDRALGVLIALASLAVIVPAMIAIKATSPGPAIFRQTRVGADGVPFTMFKLRTMRTDAEVVLRELEERSDGNEVLFKMHDDPRVTTVGRLLRRASIDELPQIWNVVRGDMSLVGPRPPLPREVAEYDDRAYKRLLAKPGMTGLWQVSGRSDLDWEQSVALDLRYVDNRNVRGDLQILGRTAGAVLGGRGAY